MALAPAKCPECGGLIEVDSDKKACVCKFCGEAFIVSDAVNNFNSYFNITNNYNTTNNYGDGAVVNIYEDKTKDFVIEGGVLKKYQGASIDVEIPDGVIGIAYGCFQNLKIQTVSIPASVTYIDDFAFNGCDNLKAVYIKDLTAWLNIIFAEAVSNPLCYAKNLYVNGKLLTDLYVPVGVTSINTHAFFRCTSLTSVTIPNSVTHIHSYAFNSCENLTSVSVPTSVRIDDAAFWGCNNIRYVTHDSVLKNKRAFPEALYNAVLYAKQRNNGLKR